MNKRSVLLVVGLVAVVAGGVSAYQWATVWRWHENTDDAYLHSDITTISPKVGGHVASVEVTDNQVVHKGDVLVRIDDRDYRAAVDAAVALVASREAALSNVEARLHLQQAQIAASEAQVSSASAELVRSKADLARSQALVRDDFVSRQRLDTNLADANKAGAGVRSAQATVDAAHRQISVLQSEMDIDRAQLDQARAQLDAAQLDLEHTVVTAPVDGMVGNRGAQVGLFVRQGQPLMSVVPLDNVWVSANFKETQIGHMQIGQPVELSIDAFPGQTITGHVNSFSPASGAEFSLLPPDNATGNFTKVVQRIPVKITVDPGHPLAGKLRPGMSAVVTVDTKASTDASLGIIPKAQAKE